MLETVHAKKEDHRAISGAVSGIARYYLCMIANTKNMGMAVT